MQLTPEERQVGSDNFKSVVGVVRRDFLRAAIGSGLSLSGGLGPLAFGYGGPQEIDEPLRIGVIGCGDQGGILIGAMQSTYHQVVAVCDIRPSSIHRAFEGDWSSPAAKRVRAGLLSKFEWENVDEARRHVKVFDDYHELLEAADVEAVIIALPLHLHHQVAIDAMRAGKHIYLETLMARTIKQCKDIARIAEETRRVCSVGHQRHYNVQYEFAADILRKHLIGQVLSIHAQWHRGNLPGRDSWQQPLPGGELTNDGRVVNDLATRIRRTESMISAAKSRGDALAIERAEGQLRLWKAFNDDQTVDAESHGYQDRIDGERRRSALEELVRWRLWDRTCGGIMNVLGHCQLDGAMLLLDALQGQAVRPLSVFATGGRALFPATREIEDQATCVIRFEGTEYEDAKGFGFHDRVANYPDERIPGFSEDLGKTISLIYSTSNGNGLAGYGEQVLGTGGSLYLNRETEALLFKNGRNYPIVVDENTTEERIEAVTQPTQLIRNDDGELPPEAGLVQAVGTDAPSRGYREALEHWAWCIRNPDPENQPRCGPQKALRNAVMAITCTEAIRRGERGMGSVVEVKPEWLDVYSDRTPEQDLR